jgi:predicted ATPase/DNA-binding SARP family transcriptional activator
MAKLNIYLFGPPRIVLEDNPVSTDRRKAIALLSYLVVTRKWHTRETLATMFWPEYPASKSYAYLRRTIWELNKMLGDGWLTIERDQLAWNRWGSTLLDVAEFHRLIESYGREDSSEECLSSLAAAAGLSHGGFLAGFSLPDAPGFDEWQFFQAESLKNQRLTILERLSVGYSSISRDQQALEFAQQWVLLDPLNENGQRWLMVLYGKLNQRAAALRQYETFQKSMQQIGLAPQAKTTALFNDIKYGVLSCSTTRQLDNPSSPATFSFAGATPKTYPSTGSVSAPTFPQATLPVPPTPFIGRSEEVEEIDLLLNDKACRLLTLLGPGGIGKTRLAIQVASHQMERFVDGIHFISLASVTEDESILPAIARVLRFAFDETAGPVRDQLLDYLRYKNLILILDNFEHLVNESAVGLPSDILATSQATKILVTSRTRLNIPGEQVFTVGGMGFPGGVNGKETIESLETYSAIRLFVQSGRRVNKDFHLDANNQRPIIKICQMLLGLPLGIELAAAWVELLEPDTILAEMQKSLDFLASDQQNIPERQRSIRAVFETTWSLLPDEERAAFLKQSVFQAGFSRQAAEQVTRSSLRTLVSLVNKSLLQRTSSERFTIHELLRQYALERLQADPESWQSIRDQHSRYFLGYLTEHGQYLMSRGQMNAKIAIDQDLDNILQAYTWALSNRQFDSLGQSTVFLGFYFASWDQAQMDSVALRGLASLAPVDETDPDSRLALVNLLTMHAVSTYDYLDPAAADSFQRAIQLVQEFPELEGKMGVLFSVLAGALIRHDPHKAIDLLERNLRRLQSNGEPWQIALTQRNLASAYILIRDLGKSRQAALEALDIDIEIGDEISMADDLAMLSALALSDHSYDVGYKLILRQREIHESLGNEGSISWTIQQLGDICLSSGEYSRAIEYYREAILRYQERGRRQWVAGAYSWLSISALRMGDIDLAREARSQSLKISEELSYQTGMIWSYAELGEIERVAGNLGAAQRWYRQAKEYLANLQVYNLRSFTCRGLGQIALLQNDLERATSLFNESLEAAREEYFTWGIAYAEGYLGRVACLRGEHHRAWELFQHAAQVLSRWGDQGVALELIGGVAQLLLVSGQLAGAMILAAFLIHYQGSWYETKERASDLFIQAASRLPSSDIVQAQRIGSQLDIDQIIEMIISGEIDMRELSQAFKPA